jgi:hypothetical protein
VIQNVYFVLKVFESRRVYFLAAVGKVRPLGVCVDESPFWRFASFLYVRE